MTLATLTLLPLALAFSAMPHAIVTTPSQPSIVMRTARQEALLWKVKARAGLVGWGDVKKVAKEVVPSASGCYPIEQDGIECDACELHEEWSMRRSVRTRDLHVTRNPLIACLSPIVYS